MTDSFEDHCWKDVFDAETLEIYRPYRRRVFVGPNPAVLAIDLYKSAYRGGPRPVAEVNREFPGSCGENAWNAVPPTQSLFAAARKASVPVVFTTRHVDTAGVQSTNRTHAALTADIYDLQEEVGALPGELIIHKERASAFFGTPLIAHLRKLRVDSLIVCGESTSGCVRASVVEAYSYGFHCTVVEECTYDRSMLNHKVNLFDLHHKYADVMHVEAVVAHLGELAHARR